MSAAESIETSALESSECTWENDVERTRKNGLSAGILNRMSIIRSTVVLLKMGWWGLMKNFFHV